MTTYTPHAQREDLLWALTASDADLTAELSKPNSTRASVVPMEVSRRNRPTLFKALAKALPTANQKVGLAILTSLERSPLVETRRVIEAVAVTHAEAKVRWSAAALSATWGFKGGQPALREAVAKDELAALRALGTVGNETDIPIVRKFYDRSLRVPQPNYGPNKSREAIQALAKLGDDWALKKYRGELDRPTNAALRADAVRVLGQVGKKQDVPRVIKALDDRIPSIRLDAVEALGLLKDRKAIDALRNYAARPTPTTVNEHVGREYAAYVADCLERGQVPVSKRQWNLKHSSNRFHGMPGSPP